MQLEGLTDNQAEAVFTITQICGLDFRQARSLLEKVDYNVEQATQLHFNPQPIQPIHYIQQQPVFHQQFINGDVYYDDEFDENQDPVYTRYRNFRYSGVTFESNYPLSGNVVTGVIGWFANKFKKEVTLGEQFTQSLQQAFPKQNKVKFLKGNFLEAMYYVRKQKFPLIVFLNNFNPEYQDTVKSLISNSNITQFFNQTFRIIGFDTRTYKLDGVLLNQIDEKNIPCLAVFKIDECQQIKMMDIIQLSSDTDITQLKKRLNISKNRYIKDEIRQDEFMKRFYNELNGIFDSNLMTFERKLQLAEERKIKAIQQNQLKQSNRLIEIKKKQQLLAQQKEKEKQNQRLKLIQQRKINRQNLKTYSQGVRIRLRLPNSNQVQIIVPLDVNIQYLFDYVNSLEDIGFQQDVYRKFDIIRPYDKLNLKQIRNKTLLDVFEETDSESLVVTEL